MNRLKETLVWSCSCTSISTRSTAEPGCGGSTGCTFSTARARPLPIHLDPFVRRSVPVFGPDPLCRHQFAGFSVPAFDLDGAVDILNPDGYFLQLRDTTALDFLDKLVNFVGDPA